MRWFKHDSDAGNDAKLRKLRIKYGAQGYGIYWYCLELIARNVEKHNLTFELEHDAELIADDFKLSTELVQEMMVYMVNLGLFENKQGVITCLKMSTRTDEYTQKLLKENQVCPDNVRTLSNNGPIKSGDDPRISELIEEKRKEEKEIEVASLIEFVEQRGASKNPFTPIGLKKLINKLSKHPIEAQKNALDTAIERGYRGVFFSEEETPALDPREAKAI